jgi:hypothetical protein
MEHAPNDIWARWIEQYRLEVIVLLTLQTEPDYSGAYFELALQTWKNLFPRGFHLAGYAQAPMLRHKRCLLDVLE